MVKDPRLTAEFKIQNNAGDHVRELVNNQRNDHNIYSSEMATEQDRFMGSSIGCDAVLCQGQRYRLEIEASSPRSKRRAI